MVINASTHLFIEGKRVILECKCFIPPKSSTSNPMPISASFGKFNHSNKLFLLAFCVFRLAATLGPKSNAKRLARKELTSINVPDTCAFLLAPPEPLSLRLSANLMIGVSRVYGQQCQYHYGDVQGLCTKLSHVNTPANPDAINLANHEK